MRPFLFTWEQIADEETSERWLVVFLSQTTVDYLPLTLSEHLEANPSYAGIILVSMTYNKEIVRSLLSDGTLHERLPTAFRCAEFANVLAHREMERSGRIVRENGECISADVTASFFQAGAQAVFFDRSAKPQSHPILEAPIGFHFVKPSKREHVTHFIRTAEILTDGSEIEFLAASLLRFAHRDVSCLACDTGSITVLAYALQALLARFAAHDGHGNQTTHQIRAPSTDWTRNRYRQKNGRVLS